MEHLVVRPRVSKFRIGDLALSSALELERARMNVAFEAAPLHQLADALQQTSLASEPGAVARMRPGYYEPFDRLYRSRITEAPQSLDEIRKLVDWAVDELKKVAGAEGKGEAASDLVNFCIQLHQEFVGRPAAEARFGRAQRTVPAAAGIS